MKLIYCPTCKDVVRLYHEKRTCLCGASWGRYTDRRNAVVGGSAVPLGIDNRAFLRAVRARARTEETPYYFDAFLIEEPCNTVERKP